MVHDTVDEFKVQTRFEHFTAYCTVLAIGNWHYLLSFWTVPPSVL